MSPTLNLLGSLQKSKMYCPLMSKFQPLKDSAACYGLRYHLALPRDVYQLPGYAQCAQIGRSEGWED